MSGIPEKDGKMRKRDLAGAGWHLLKVDLDGGRGRGPLASACCGVCRLTLK